MLRPAEFKPHWKEGLPNEEYHADKNSVSSSGLRKILKSPRSFKTYLDSPPDDPTDAQAFGTLVHQVVLEGPEFLKRYVVAPDFTALYGHYNSKLHKEGKARWYEEHRDHIIVTQQEFDDVRGMLDSVIGHPDALALLKDGVTEVSGYYADPETGILCRIRPDFYSPQLRALVDLKTTQSCEEHDFSKSIWNFGYHVQMSMYSEGIQIIDEQKVEHEAFVVVEKKKPYEVAVYVADQALMEKGAQDYHRALRILRNCLGTGVWPGYQQKLQTISLPPWSLGR
jgi:PDDEXK-like domain of unknown function (DUF3799)